MKPARFIALLEVQMQMEALAVFNRVRNNFRRLQEDVSTIDLPPPTDGGPDG